MPAAGRGKIGKGLRSTSPGRLAELDASAQLTPKAEGSTRAQHRQRAWYRIHTDRVPSSHNSPDAKVARRRCQSEIRQCLADKDGFTGYRCSRNIRTVHDKLAATGENSCCQPRNRSSR
jgi:hypothetical protein